MSRRDKLMGRVLVTAGCRACRWADGDVPFRSFLSRQAAIGIWS